MRLFKPQIKHLGFDDRVLMIIGIPILSLIMPILLDLYIPDKHVAYWTHQVPESLFFVIGFWYFYRTLCIHLRKQFPRFSQTYKRLIYQGLIFVISAPILKEFFGLVLWTIFRLCYIEYPQSPDHMRALLAIYLPSGLIIAIYEAVFFFVKYRSSLIERERIQNAHIKSELDNLRNQINPHFLFNSLNTLMNLIPTDQDKAMKFLSKLSKFYRFAVGNREEKMIDLCKELECAYLYIDLLKERFKDGLQVDIQNVKEGTYKILPMSLQMLIENAVKHNIVSKAQPLNIQISLD